jgi:hypothetical protein
MPHADATVHFVELAAPDARRVLSALSRRSAAQGAVSELLHSADRDDLWLLVVRGAPPPADAVPAAARTWRFNAVEGAR